MKFLLNFQTKVVCCRMCCAPLAKLSLTTLALEPPRLSYLINSWSYLHLH